MPRVTRSLQPYFKHDGSVKATGDFDLDVYALLTKDLAISQLTANQMWISNRAGTVTKSIMAEGISCGSFNSLVTDFPFSARNIVNGRLVLQTLFGGVQEVLVAMNGGISIPVPIKDTPTRRR